MRDCRWAATEESGSHRRLSMVGGGTQRSCVHACPHDAGSSDQIQTSRWLARLTTRATLGMNGPLKRRAQDHAQPHADERVRCGCARGAHYSMQTFHDQATTEADVAHHNVPLSGPASCYMTGT